MSIDPSPLPALSISLCLTKLSKDKKVKMFINKYPRQHFTWTLNVSKAIQISSFGKLIHFSHTPGTSPEIISTNGVCLIDVGEENVMAKCPLRFKYECLHLY